MVHAEAGRADRADEGAEDGTDAAAKSTIKLHKEPSAYLERRRQRKTERMCKREGIWKENSQWMEAKNKGYLLISRYR